MKCGHCLTDFHAYPDQSFLGTDVSDGWLINNYRCSNCKNFNIYLESGKMLRDLDGFYSSKSPISRMVYPKTITRLKMSDDIPQNYLNLYNEACLVLSDSPMASAALSRRALQQILRDKGGFKAKSLAEEIQQAIDSKTLPSYVTNNIDAIRNIGNFAAHPSKSTNSGEIIEVEAGEAEWNLDVLEMLYDIYFVQPAIIQKKREELNKKLAEAGKPPMK